MRVLTYILCSAGALAAGPRLTVIQPPVAQPVLPDARMVPGLPVFPPVIEDHHFVSVSAPVEVVIAPEHQEVFEAPSSMYAPHPPLVMLTGTEGNSKKETVILAESSPSVSSTYILPSKSLRDRNSLTPVAILSRPSKGGFYAAARPPTKEEPYIPIQSKDIRYAQRGEM